MSAVEEYLERIPMWAAKKNSLEDVRAYLEEMGSPDRGMKIIHVAGTNGDIQIDLCSLIIQNAAPFLKDVAICKKSRDYPYSF